MSSIRLFMRLGTFVDALVLWEPGGTIQAVCLAPHFEQNVAVEGS